MRYGHGVSGTCVKQGRCGGAVVELAVLAPFLFFALLIAIDYARVFYTSLTLENCARNGAIYGSQILGTTQWQGSGSIASIQSAAIAEGSNLNPPLTTSDVSVTTGTNDADGNPIVVVTVTYTFHTLTAFPGIPSSQTLTRTAQMRMAPQ